MRRVTVLVVLAVVVLSLCCGLCESLLLPSAMSSHMVLQRAPRQARVWGEAGVGSVVTVTLDGLPPLRTFADSNGTWLLALPPQPASINRTLLISADGDSLTLHNVAFGDVYLCAGQSKSVQ